MILILIGFNEETLASSPRHRYRASRPSHYTASQTCLPIDGPNANRTIHAMQEFVRDHVAARLSRFSESPLDKKAQTLVLGGAGPEGETAHYAQSLVEALEQAGAPIPVRYVPISVDLPSELQRVHNVGLTLSYRSTPIRAGASGGRFLDALTERISSSFVDNTTERTLVGYSYGSVLAAQTALRMSGNGLEVSNLVLVASPIAPDSALAADLRAQSGIKKIIWIEIPGDPFSGGISLRDLTQLDSHFVFAERSEDSAPTAQQTELSEGIIRAFAEPNHEQRLQIPSSFIPRY